MSVAGNRALVAALVAGKPNVFPTCTLAVAEMKRIATPVDLARPTKPALVPSEPGELVGGCVEMMNDKPPSVVVNTWFGGWSA